MSEFMSCPDCKGTKSDRALWCPHCGSITFFRMVTFFAAAAVAFIPAGMILTFAGMLLSLFFGGASR